MTPASLPPGLDTEVTAVQSSQRADGAPPASFLAEVGNVEAMASYAIKLLSDDKLLAEIKKKAKARALEFDLVNILPIYEKMYEETLEEFHKMA